MAKKEAEYTIFAVFMIIILALIISYIPQHSSGMITGNVIFDNNQPELKNKVVSLVNKFPPMQAVGKDAQFCIQILDSESIYGYMVDNFDGAWNINPAKDGSYCSGNVKMPLQGEDFVIKYMSYDKFLQHLNSPACSQLKNSKPGDIFYLLPSEFVKSGGGVVCNDVFQQKYCAAARKCFSSKELMLYGMKCCRTDLGILEMPGIFGRLYFWLITLAMFIVILTATFMVFKKHALLEKEAEQAAAYAHQLEEYVEKALSMGHNKDIIKNKLLQEGWDEGVIDSILKGF